MIETLRELLPRFLRWRMYWNPQRVPEVQQRQELLSVLMIIYISGQRQIKIPTFLQ